MPEFTLSHPEGTVEAAQTDNGRLRLAVAPRDVDRAGTAMSCETSYPRPLIEAILQAKGPAYLCDEIARDEDPDYIEGMLIPDMLGFVPRDAIDGARILDFGCGSGASTMVLGRNFPAASLVGVDLLKHSLEIAQMRADFHCLDNVRFVLSPSPKELPGGLGSFDCVVLSAVYEHLLPDERPVVLGQVWDALKPGGVLFLDQTPHRFFPIEHHTSHLPGLNYLPSRLAAPYARRFSGRVNAEDDWSTMLRNGIRGGTRREILRVLRKHSPDSRPVALAPLSSGLKDTADVWYHSTSFREYPRGRRVIWAGAKAIERVFGWSVVPYLALAIRKEATAQAHLG